MTHKRKNFGTGILAKAKPRSFKRAVCKKAAFVLLLCFCVFLFAVPVDGDVVWIRGTSEPISGQITSQTPDQIQIKVFANGKFGEIKTYPAKDVEAAVVNIDLERLSNLTPNNPVAYRNYAEELSAQRSDPAAVNLARRLYLLAATNSIESANSELHSGAMLGLMSLATDEIQRRKLEMYYQLSTPDAGKFKRTSTTPVRDAPSAAEKELMLRVVVAIRREDHEIASGLLASKENRESMKKWSNLCTLQELDRFATAEQPSKTQLKKLLAVELAVRQSGASSTKQTPSKPTWGDLAMETVSEFSVLPTAANMTEFDPRRSVFRNGNWVRP